MPEHRIKDNIINGFLLGTICIGLNYFLFTGLKNLLDADHLLGNNRIALILLAINIILFRFLMIKWNRPQTGKGVFLSILVIAIIYILIHKNKIVI